MNIAVLVISVGIELKPLSDELKKEFKDYYILSASLRKEGSIENAMRYLCNGNFKRVVVVPAFVYEGREYKRACDKVNEFKDRLKLSFITPLVTCYEDFENIVGIISLNKKEIYCVHQSEINLKSLMKNVLLWEMGSNYMPVINNVISRKISEVYIHPFMLSFGYHGKKDILGRFKPELEKQGVKAYVIEKGLIDYKRVRNIFVNKIKEICYNEFN